MVETPPGDGEHFFGYAVLDWRDRAHRKGIFKGVDIKLL